ncbi:MAG: lipopolysaccharide transport periplasmic protein LptA [Gallionella sp.]|nr:lipopolysaccharide transport periplasmic protein LptA [Gallionella sp.]
MFPQKNNLLLAFFLMLYAASSFAERADREKPVQLDADKVTIDDAKKISTFTGGVKLTQGTLQLLGDKVVVTQNKEGFTLATVYGKTASFRQKREGLNEYVEGSGERIVYDSRAETVDFYNQARVKRDLDDVRGEHISYSVKTEIFQVSGSSDNSTNAPPKRVRAVLQSKIKKSTPALPDAAATPAK